MSLHTQDGEQETDEIGLALCIYGKDLIPDEITSLLGCKPTHSHVTGDVKGPLSPPFTQGGWFLELRGDLPHDLDVMFGELLAKLPQDPNIWQGLSERYLVRVHFGVHTGQGCSVLIGPLSIRLLALTRAELLVDIYAYGKADA